MVSKIKPVGLNARLVRWLASPACWYVVLAVFVLNAAWLAVSAAYPMAFDERYHFGLIQLHAHQWLPFFTHQPPTGQYGAVVRDPSYLYHWLMSLPYRVISLFVHGQTVQIFVLRFINIGLFAYALVLYRRLMRRFGLSAALTNGALMTFVLIPVAPFLAATINYDNLLIVILAWSLLLTLDVSADFRKRRVPIARLSVLLSVLLLGGLVKYSFLPVMVMIVAFLLVVVWRRGLCTAKVWRDAWRVVRLLSGWQQGLLLVLVVVSLGLFTERYAVNTVRYHTPIPACNQVISEKQCLEYGPWTRDYELADVKPVGFHPNLPYYIFEWLNGMWYRLFFAIGPEPDYYTKPPLFIMGCTAIVVMAVLFLGVLARLRWLFVGHSERLLLLLILFGYGVVLFANSFSEYTRTAQPVAINGRYWLPFLPLFFVLAGLAWSDILRRYAGVKTGLMVIVLAAFLLQGGGAMTYIVRSDASWYWPNSEVRRSNLAIRDAISPFIFGKDLLHPK